MPIERDKTNETYHDRVKSEKRAAALTAAAEVFLQNGYDRTTLAHVASVANISTGTLFKHFPTKAELFGALMEEMWEADPGKDIKLPKAGNPREGLVELGSDYARKLRQPQTEPFFRVIIAETARFPELGKALFERGKVPYLNRTYAYLRSEVAAGTMAIDDVELAGRQFFGMINDVIFWPRFLATDLVITDKDVDHVIAEAVLTMLARYAK